MPLSCWPIVITMTVMSCHLTPRSLNNCQGFLGFSPSKAKHSRWMSSISLRYSEEPWNRFKATKRKKFIYIYLLTTTHGKSSLSITTWLLLQYEKFALWLACSLLFFQHILLWWIWRILWHFFASF